jgi:hypothetical protein
MTLDFRPIRLADQLRYRAYLKQCPQPSSDYSFTNVWGWSGHYRLEWAWESDLVWIRQHQPEPVYWAPVGDWKAIDWAQRLPACLAPGALLRRIPEELALQWTEGEVAASVEITDDRGNWDYLYDRQALSELAGNRFHKKKNLVNQFTKKYDYHYIALTAETAPQALALQNDWCLWRDCESIEVLEAENQVIEKVLLAWDRLGELTGGALLVDDHMVAYTVAEALSDEMLVIHFEKANPDYKGVYQAINQIFLNEAATAFTTINREQDLNDPGLRKAKESYRPVGYLKKFQATFQPPQKKRS